jgi:hypothetical protein
MGAHDEINPTLPSIALGVRVMQACYHLFRKTYVCIVRVEGVGVVRGSNQPDQYPLILKNLE